MECACEFDGREEQGREIVNCQGEARQEMVRSSNSVRVRPREYINLTTIQLFPPKFEPKFRILRENINMHSCGMRSQ